MIVTDPLTGEVTHHDMAGPVAIQLLEMAYMIRCITGASESDLREYREAISLARGWRQP